MSPTRKTYAVFGRVGEGQVRVLADERRGRILVQWYEGSKARKKVFPETKAGRIEAQAWAEGFHAERIRRGKDHPITLRGLWDAYREVAFLSLRPRTRELYRERWLKWEDFIGKDVDPDAVALSDIDRFVVMTRRLGKSMNQARHVLNVARVVFNWGMKRKYVTATDLTSYRWNSGKEGKPLEIPEHSPDDHRKLLAVLPPTESRYWRLWCLLVIAGSQGPRIRTARYLKWSDVEDGTIHWPAATMKQGVDFHQPLTEQARQALEVARQWRTKDGYNGPYVFYAARTGKEPVYTYQSAWIALQKAEKRAGVAHHPYRAFHGFRRMAAGNVYDALKDPLAAAEWIGDQDVKQMRSYLKRRTNRLEAAKAATEGM